MFVRTVRILAAIVLLITAAHAENVLLTGGTLVDGSGKTRIRANVRIRDGKITDIGNLTALRGELTLNVTGLIVAPGFVDAHNHSTILLSEHLDAQTQLAQGITSIVVGLDGEGPFEVEDFMAPFDE